MPLAPYGTLPSRLQQKLAEPLPGVNAQYDMAPFGRAKIDIQKVAEGTYTESAVLVLLCHDASNGMFIPLIERPEYEGVHSGQISLPGGKKDPGDISIENTAKRECQEELSAGGDCRIIGSLTPLFIPVSSYLVHPFVGYSEHAAIKIVPHPREVRSVVRLYLTDLLRAELRSEGEVRVGTNTLNAPCYRVDCHLVWGATAMILSELRHVLMKL